MKKLPLMIGLAAALCASGCVQPPPPTALELSWKNYQLCVHEPHAVAARCERLRLAYETQLNRAPR